jgi:hypothetical protein
VPEAHIGQLVYVCVGPDRLEVFDRGVHPLGELKRIPAGADKIAASDRKRRGRYDVMLLQARFAAWGPAAEDFATKLRVRKRTPGPSSTTSVLLGAVARRAAGEAVEKRAGRIERHRRGGAIVIARPQRARLARATQR